MLYKTVFSVFLLSLAVLTASDNLLVNGKFSRGLSSYPADWRFYNIRTTGYLETFPNGGPGNGNYLRMNGKFRINQKSITLVNGERYKLSAFIRSRKQNGEKSGVYLPGYKKPLLQFPADQKQWKYVERIWIHRNGKASTPVKVNVGVNAEGEQLDIADLKLVPMTEKGKALSGNMYDSSRPALIPRFLTGYIPLSKPEVTFSWEGRFPGNLNAARCKIKLEKSGKVFTGKFVNRLVKVQLSGVPAGKDRLHLTVSDGTGKDVFKEAYEIEIRDIPAMPAKARKLNNLTTELPAMTLKQGRQGTVINPREGWLYFSFKGDGEFVLTLDGKNLLDHKTLCHEAFLRLEPGKYQVKAEKGSGVLTVRLIAETILFPIQHSHIAWEMITADFVQKHHLSALTTINCGGKPETYRSAGRNYLTNFGIVDLRKHKTTVQSMLDRMNRAKNVFESPQFDGSTLDEMDYAFSTSAFEKYTDLIRQFANPGNKLLYTYATGPVITSYREFFSAAVNASGSKGKILHECYERMKPTEKAMYHHLDQLVARMMAYRAETPGGLSHIAMIFDLSSELPKRSVAHYPEQDMKYHLDMLMYRAATDPALDGLGAIGYWGAHHASGETQRWAMRLLRHYVIEGKKTMLSAEYGFRYHPGHVKNPDFMNKLESWQAKGQVRHDSFATYGSLIQLRSQAFAGLGDSFALFSRTADEYGELCQTLKGFIPGKTYTLSYLTCDREAMESNRYMEKAYGLDFELKGVRIKRNTLFTDPRFSKGKRVKDGKHPCINQRFVVFTAEKPELELIFNNKSAAPGERIALNHVSVRPYFDNEQ